MVGAEVVCAAGYGGVQFVGSAVSLDEHVCAGFRGRVGVGRFRWILLCEGAFKDVAVDFVCGYLDESGFFLVFSYCFKQCECSVSVVLYEGFRICDASVNMGFSCEIDDSIDILEGSLKKLRIADISFDEPVPFIIFQVSEILWIGA